MRISDWSSDVCASDLAGAAFPGHGHPARRLRGTIRAAAGGRLPRRGRAGRVRLEGRRGHVRLRERAGRIRAVAQRARAGRSEEHTSELQSLMRISYAVFCLKKNKKCMIKTPIQNKCPF